MTEPLEPSTLPKRTIENVVVFCLTESACNISSATRLVAPMVFVGRTALSVDISTKFLTPESIADIAQFNVPKTLLSTPSVLLNSTMGTCLYAAA